MRIKSEKLDMKNAYAENINPKTLVKRLNFNDAESCGVKSYVGILRPIGKIVEYSTSYKDLIKEGEFEIVVKETVTELPAYDVAYPMSGNLTATAFTYENKNALYLSDGKAGYFFDGTVSKSTVAAEASVFAFSRLFVASGNEIRFSESLDPYSIGSGGSITLSKTDGDIIDLVFYTDRLMVFTERKAYALYFSGSEYKLYGLGFDFNKIEKGSVKIFNGKLLFVADGTLYKTSRSGGLDVVYSGVSGAAITDCGYYFIKGKSGVLAFDENFNGIKINASSFDTLKHAFSSSTGVAKFNPLLGDGKVVFELNANSYGISKIEARTKGDVTFVINSADNPMKNALKISAKDGFNAYPVKARGKKFYLTAVLGNGAEVYKISVEFNAVTNGV